MENCKGIVHSLESFGSVDGPGVRFVVFMQGCNMRCKYCHNPETWSCSGGEEWSAEDLFKHVFRYRTYWGKNMEKGGVTVSGGEPLMQIDFLIEFFKILKANGVHTTLDTSGQPFTKEEAWLGKFDELMKYTDWRKGKRLVAAGSFSTQLKLKGKNKSYECFRAYLECVMNYAGTKSLYDESETIPLSDFKPGDILLIPGSPGHVVLAVDMAVNADGEKCYLFAQGYMPAQSFHMIENDKHLDDPWFYESELKEKFRVGSYTFTDDNVRRWQNGF